MVFFFSLSFQFLITTILLSLTPFSRTTRIRGDDETDIAKQHRLFSQMNNWPFPISEMLGDEQMMSDEAQLDSPNPEVLLIDDLTFKQRFHCSQSSIQVFPLFDCRLFCVYFEHQEKFPIPAIRSRARATL